MKLKIAKSIENEIIIHTSVGMRMLSVNHARKIEITD